MVLGLLQKQHDLSPFQFLFTKLSLVRIISLLKNQRKMSIFKCIFNCQTICETFNTLMTRYMYIKFVNKQVFCNVHTKIPLPCCRLTLAIIATRWFHSSSLFLTKALLNSTLRGIELNTSASFACFLLTMLNNVKYWVFNGRFRTKYPLRTLFDYHPLT
jgi:hypothetical protein